MINPEQAEKIVKDCIKGTIGNANGYRADKPLGALGIMTDKFLDTFKKTIRSDEQRGVKSLRHTLAAAELDAVGIDTEAGDVENIIFEKAKPAKTKILKLKTPKAIKPAKKIKEIKLL